MTKNEGMLKGLVIGLLAGGAIGAVVALLYAPKSGRELRADLKEKADEFRDDAEEYLTVARTKAGDMVSEAKKRSESLITDAKRKADTLLVDAEKVLTDARQKTGSMGEEASRVKHAVKAGMDAFKEERRRS
jgi:gas vesicle protein